MDDYEIFDFDTLVTLGYCRIVRVTETREYL